MAVPRYFQQFPRRVAAAAEDQLILQRLEGQAGRVVAVNMAMERVELATRLQQVHHRETTAVQGDCMEARIQLEAAAELVLLALTQSIRLAETVELAVHLQ